MTHTDPDRARTTTSDVPRTVDAERAVAPLAQLGKGAIAALGLLAVATGALESVVTPTLPLLQDELGLSPSKASLVSIVLLIAGVISTPIAGKLGDRFGGRRILVALMSVVSIGGLVSAVAPSFAVLLLGQALQGAMVGALPLSFILVRRHLPEDRSKVAIGLVSGLFVGGGMAGTVSAGPVAESLSRHWMFAIPTFAVIAATVLIYHLMPNDPPTRSGRMGFDWPGLVLFSGTVITLMAILSLSPDTFGSRPLLVLTLIAMLGLFATAWFVAERRATSPMIDLHMLVRPAVWKACVMTFVICVGTSVPLFLIPQLLAAPSSTYGFGATATEIGFFLLPGAVAATLAGPLSGIGARRIGARAVVFIGVAIMVTGLVALATLHSQAWHLVAAKILISLANGLVVTAMVTNTATSVDEGDTGVATGLVLVTRVLGFAVGTQLSAAALTAWTPSGSEVPAESAFVISFLVAATIAALSLFIVRTMKESTHVSP